MYIRKTGYVVGTPNPTAQNIDETKRGGDSYKVVKMGRVLTRQEEGASYFHKSADIASIANRGLDYYQVISTQGACERCERHNGAIYPVAEAKDGENLPPFHPNCKCTIQGFDTKNPNHDPWLAETLFWLDIMYGDGSIEKKAQKLLDFYSWTEFSQQEMKHVLSGTEHIKHVGKRMYAFFEMLENDLSKDTVENWLNIYHSPTVYGTGRVVEMPKLEGWNPYNWYAFEEKVDINRYAKIQMDIDGVSYEVHVGSKGELTDADGRYWIAVGPNVMNPDHLPSEGLTLEEMKYGSKVDVVLRHDDGTMYYLPCVIGDAKAHTWPDGIFQTGYRFPNGTDHHPIDKIGWPIEFIGAKLPKGLIDFEIINIIVYD